MIPKSGNRFSDKIMLERKNPAGGRTDEASALGLIGIAL
jgi:hypothetical protein